MSSAMVQETDWTTQGNATAGGPASGFVIEADDLIADTDASTIEQEAADRDFQAPEPGDYTFKVLGFWKDPEPVSKTGYVGGEPVSCTPFKVGVKLGVKGRENYSLMEFLELPPRDAAGRRAWQVLQKKADGRPQDAGFMFRKTQQFIDRLGFPWPKGAPFPAAAGAINDWIGREINATVIPGKVEKDPDGNPKRDPSTNEPYKPKPQIKLFSFRFAESTLSNPAGGNPPTAGAPAARPSQQPAPAGAAFANAGLDNI